MRLSAEIVNGKCPTCYQYSILFGLSQELYKCLTCGADLHQHVNGKISYLPAIQVPKGAKPFVREWKEEADGKNKV